MPKLKPAARASHAEPLPSAPAQPDATGLIREKVLAELGEPSDLLRVQVKLLWGKYYRATGAEGEVEEIAKALAEMDASGSKTVLKTRWVERFQIPLAIALFALILETLISDRRKLP